MLGTDDAHGLYRRFGFREPARPDLLMERVQPAPDVYRRAADTGQAAAFGAFSRVSNFERKRAEPRKLHWSDSSRTRRAPSG